MQIHTQQAESAHQGTQQYANQGASVTHAVWQRIRKSLFGLRSNLLAASLLTGLVLTAPAQAQVTCGDVIGDDPREKKVVLTGFVGACDDGTGSTALTVRGPATLDLNGFTVACADLDDDGQEPSVGIRLVGERAKLIGRGGAVSGCPIGVSVEEGGKHRVDGVVVQSGEQGFRVTSSRNTLKKNIAENIRERSGFLISGTRNVLTQNVAQDMRRGAGFVLIGERHRMIRNRSQDNGIELPAPGISVLGDKHTLMKNEVLRNSGDGISLAFSATQVKVMRNDVRFNIRNGIVAQSGAQKNTIMRNVARNNGLIAGTDDLKDRNLNCGTNRWRNNDFGSTTQACID